MRRMAFLSAALAVFAVCAYADIYSFANNTGQAINFDGQSHFSFGDPADAATQSQADSHITNGPAALLGLNQDIGGVFTIGAVTTVSPGVYTAPVTGGPHTYQIWDSLGVPLSGMIDFKTIKTDNTSNTLNIEGVLNVDYNTYTGTNTALQNFLGQKGSAVVTFQFVPAMSLPALTTTVTNTSFSGTVSVPDGGTTVMLLGSSLFIVGAFRRKFRV